MIRLKESMSQTTIHGNGSWNLIFYTKLIFLSTYRHLVFAYNWNAERLINVKEFMCGICIHTAPCSSEGGKCQRVWTIWCWLLYKKKMPFPQLSLSLNNWKGVVGIFIKYTNVFYQNELCISIKVMTCNSSYLSTNQSHIFVCIEEI